MAKLPELVLRLRNALCLNITVRVDQEEFAFGDQVEPAIILNQDGDPEIHIIHGCDLDGDFWSVHYLWTDPGVRMRSDGTGDPPSSDLKELGFHRKKHDAIVDAFKHYFEIVSENRLHEIYMEED